MATYVGFKKDGLPGALVATAAVVLPAFIAIVAVASVLFKYYNDPLTQSIFKGIRGAVIGLIAITLISICRAAVSELRLPQAFVITLIAIVSVLAFSLFKINPVVLIVLSGLIGLALGLLRFW